MMSLTSLTTEGAGEEEPQGAAGVSQRDLEETEPEGQPEGGNKGSLKGHKEGEQKKQRRH